jgi:hypothetical protein
MMDGGRDKLRANGTLTVASPFRASLETSSIVQARADEVRVRPDHDVICLEICCCGLLPMLLLTSPCCWFWLSASPALKRCTNGAVGA